MSITVYPYKLTERVLEARLAPGLTVLPSQLLRFEGQKLVYGKIAEVHALPAPAAGMPEGVGVIIELLYGVPSLEPQTISLLTAGQMAQEVQKLLEPLTHPLRLSNRFSVDFERLGTFTLVESNDFLLKFEVLHKLVEAIKAYRRVLIIDPLGIFEEGEGYTYRKAGRDVRLSVQQVGTKQFLEAFGELFSPELREAVLRAVADHLPMTNGFIGFNHWLNLESAVNVPLKNLIVQNYHAVMHNQVFADTPQQSLALSTFDQAVCVLDISELPDPWKGMFYRETCRAVFGLDADGMIPVLLYPEKYLPDLLSWVQMADETGLNLLMLASSFSQTTSFQATLREKASNYIWVESAEQMELQGSLTLGLPVSLPLLTHAAFKEREQASTKPVSQDYAAEPVNETEYEPYFPPPPTNTLLNEPSSGQSSGGLLDQDEPLNMPSTVDWGATELRVNDASEQLQLEEELVSVSPDTSNGSIEPLESAGPIIDLSSPPPESDISFLSSEQLSQLLASNPQPTALETDQDTKPPHKPVARQVQPGGTPVVFDEAPSELPLHDRIVEDEAPYAYSSFQVDLTDIPSPGNEASNEPVSVPIQHRPLHSPFPAPEEYEKEEFSFDLEPAISTKSMQTVESTSGVSSEGIRESVSRSLDEFSQDTAIKLDEPLFEIEPTSLKPPTSPQVVSATQAAIAPVVSPDVSTVQPDAHATSALLEDEEMQDALDLIFPLQPDVQTTASSSKATPDIVPNIVKEEQMPIYQKQEMPLTGNQSVFQAGTRVRHATYGEGVIQKVIPMDETVILNIVFDSVGKRLLDPALCELTQMDR